MMGRLLRLLTFRRRRPQPHYYPEAIERHLRELGHSPFAEELQR